MESATGSSGGGASAEAVEFHWKDHVTDLVRQGTSSNFRFKCLHCGKSMSGAKTKLVDHFLGSGTPGCRACPAGTAGRFGRAATGQEV